MDHFTKSEPQPKKEKKAVTDKAGHYDLDGASQTEDCEVILAGDKTRPNKPGDKKSLQELKIKFKNWISEWDDEHP